MRFGEGELYKSEPAASGRAAVRLGGPDTVQDIVFKHY